MNAQLQFQIVFLYILLQWQLCDFWDIKQKIFV